MTSIDNELLFETFYEEVITIYDPEDILFEVYKDRNPVLKKIDKNFKDLKEDIKNIQTKKDLVKNIKDFMGVNRVFLKIKKNWYNASVLPTYKRIAPKAIQDDLEKSLKGKSTKPSMEEVSQYIEKVHIFLGDQLIENHSPRELTAILLHEMGHVFGHTSSIPIILGRFAKMLSGMGMVTQTIAGIANIIKFVSPISAPIMGTLFITSRSLTFYEHMREHGADKFAVEHGYGDEIFRTLNKFKNAEISHKKRMNVIKRVYYMIKEFFFPVSHPSSSKRMCDVADKMQKEYKDMYPELRDDITVVLSDLKCDNVINKTKYALGYN